MEATTRTLIWGKVVHDLFSIDSLAIGSDPRRDVDRFRWRRPDRPPTMKLSQALRLRCPDDLEWAQRAVSNLADGLDDDAPVHDVARGWMRLGAGAGAVLVDTLFILDGERLGFCQTEVETSDPSWIPVSTIVAMDAIEGSDYPLQPIEVHLQGELAVFVGWPDDFCEAVVSALTARGGSSIGDFGDLDARTPDARGDTGVGDLGDPGARGGVDLIGDRLPPELGDPATIEAVNDTSSLDELAPSAWVEQAVPAGDTDDAEHDALADHFFEVEQAEAQESAGQPSAWDGPGMVWPDPFRGTTYLGGHRDHPRRRKNSTLLFDPDGVAAAATGFTSWSMRIDWADVENLEIQGADEFKFTHNVRIDVNGSAVIVTCHNGDVVLFEVRGRRPPSMRSTLAPVLGMVRSTF